jgi:hypothetical protein
MRVLLSLQMKKLRQQARQVGCCVPSAVLLAGATAWLVSDRRDCISGFLSGLTDFGKKLQKGVESMVRFVMKAFQLLSDVALSDGQGLF